MNVSLQPLAESEFPAYLAWLKANHAEEIAKTDHLPQEVATGMVEAKTDALLPHGIHTPEHFFYQLHVEEIGGVGRAWLHINPQKKIAWLYHLWVDPNFRGQGWGRKAMESLLDEGRNRGAEVFWLNVLEENAGARHLYESMGLKSVARHMNLPLV